MMRLLTAVYKTGTRNAVIKVKGNDDMNPNNSYSAQVSRQWYSHKPAATDSITSRVLTLAYRVERSGGTLEDNL
jgi:hypothetical protein